MITAKNKVDANTKVKIKKAAPGLCLQQGEAAFATEGRR
jgi:hypothetical protein